MVCVCVCVCGLMDNFKLSILHMLFVGYMFCTSVCEDNSTMTQFTLPEIWKQHALLINIHDEDFGVLWYQPEKRFTFLIIKAKPVNIRVFGVIKSDGKFMPPFIFPLSLRLNIKLQDREGSCWKTLRLNPAIKTGEASFVCQLKFLQTNHPDIWPPISPDCNPFDYFVMRVALSDKLTKLLATLKTYWKQE